MSAIAVLVCSLPEDRWNLCQLNAAGSSEPWVAVTLVKIIDTIDKDEAFLLPARIDDGGMISRVSRSWNGEKNLGPPIYSGR